MISTILGPSSSRLAGDTGPSELVAPPLQNLGGAQARIGLKQRLEPEDLGMGVPEQKASDGVQFVRVVRHELPAVADFRRGLVPGTVRERVDQNYLAPFAVPECVVESV